MKKIIVALLLTVCGLLSSVFLSSCDKTPMTEYIKYEGNLIDLSTLPKKLVAYYNTDRGTIAPEKIIDSFNTYYKHDNVSGVILKITVNEYAEAVAGTYVSHINCTANKVFYQNENNSLQIEEGQKITCEPEYGVIRQEEKLYFVSDTIPTILRKGYSYIVFGTMDTDGNVEISSYCTAFEISSDEEEKAFYELVGIEREGGSYYYDVKSRVLEYYK